MPNKIGVLVPVTVPYRPILNWVIDRPHKVGLAAAGMLVIAVCFIPYMGRSFLPEFNEGSLTLGSNTLPGTNLEEANQLGRQMEEVLLSHPEVVAVGRQQGRAELSEHAIGVEGAETEVSIDMDRPLEKGLPKRTKAELLAALRNDFARIPGLVVQIGQPISHRIDHMLSGTRAAVAPVLMTALTAGLGLVPLALSGSQPGNEIQTPLAIVVVFGLFSSTLLNMVVVPALFLRWAGATPPAASDSQLDVLPAPAGFQGHYHPHKHTKAAVA